MRRAIGQNALLLCGVALALLVPGAVVSGLPAGPALHAQEPTPVFKARSDLVVIHVNVFDGKSDAVPDLPQRAFQVVEDGRTQKITFFNAADVPVTVGLVIDNSGSMITRRNMVLAGGTVFAESSHPEDELFTVVFNENVRFGLPEPLLFTQSRPLIQASLISRDPGGMTALYDAVVEALDRLHEATHQKRVLVVLSDGGDNASKRSRADMLHRALRSDALIYTIWTGDLAGNLGNRGVLRELSERTGGVNYAPRSEMAVVAAFKEIADNIRRGYSIGYVPSNPAADGEYRRIKVMVRVPGKTLSVRARDGYSASDGNNANAQ